MSVKKSILAVTIALIILVFVNLINFPNLNVLKVSFQFKEKLEIKLCNPTYGFIVFYGNYSHSLNVFYKTYLDDSDRNLGAHGIGSSPDGFGPIGYLKYIMPKQCVYLEDDIRPFLKVPSKPSNIRQLLDPDKTSKPAIKSFKVRLELAAIMLVFGGRQEFESQWFELNPDLTQVD